MDVTVSPAPVLPLDLERKIFEISACSRPVLIPKLMLVAWRVKEWVEPMLYRTIAVQYTDAIDGYPIFTWDVLLSAMRSKPPSFFHYAVRNICLLLTDGVKANVETLLGLCTRVHNLSLSPAYVDDDYDRAMPILLAPLPLTHLYGNLRPIFRSLPSTDPLFAHITHLCSRNWLGFDDTEMTSRLSLMPHLTHLSFDFTPFISVCPLVLENCKSLCVLVFLGHPASLWSYREDVAVLRRDIRFVAMLNAWHLKDWQMGTHAGVDYWMRAEDFIAKRRSGEIDALEYDIPDDASVLIS